MPRGSVRQQIVDAAMDQFHLHGYNGCGVKDITDAAKAPKGSFYNHFESKEALALEVLRRYEADCSLDSLADTSTEPIARLRAFFESLRASLERFGYSRGCLFGNLGTEMADHSGAMRTQIGQSLDRWTSSLAVPLREARTSGLLAASHDPDQLSRFLVDAWQGAVVRSKVSRSRVPLDDFFTVVFGSILV
ncbi:TetR family transcriptional regulator C-terminal domain-containing protein [Actinomadura sp. 9N215]|uniref:TetR/AcrR family transcriptional regulator n=1 Tax=Actinomadura sp. 9N215 TaxID=3375150 RepID=UPI0037B0C41F